MFFFVLDCFANFLIFVLKLFRMNYAIHVQAQVFRYVVYIKKMIISYRIVIILIIIIIHIIINHHHMLKFNDRYRQQLSHVVSVTVVKINNNNSNNKPIIIPVHPEQQEPDNNLQHLQCLPFRIIPVVVIRIVVVVNHVLMF